MIELRKIKSLTTLMRWRAEVIAHVFQQVPDSCLLEANRKYYIKHIADNTHVAYVAMYDDDEAGCGAICFADELPSPDNPTGKCAYLMNIYVREAFRRQGIGHAIVNALVKVAKTRDCGKIFLETTADGRPLYESLGFSDMHDMMKYYDNEH